MFLAIFRRTHFYTSLVLTPLCPFEDIIAFFQNDKSWLVVKLVFVKPTIVNWNLSHSLTG